MYRCATWAFFFNADLSNLFDLNFIPKFQKLKNILRIWSCRDLTPLGKIAIIKSLGLSQLIFLLSVLPDPPAQFIKELDAVVYKFIWSGKPEKVKRLTVIGDYSEGGLRMCHIPSLIKGLKIAWVKRLIDSKNTGKWKIFFDYNLRPLGGNLLWYCNMNPSEKGIGKINNLFVRNTVSSWCSIAYRTTTNNFHDQVIWNNSSIRINNNTQYNHNWYNNGIKYFKDLLQDNGNTLTFNQFTANYPRVKCNFMDYFSLVHAIPSIWKKSKIAVDRANHNSWQNELIGDMCKASKVCRFIQKLCVNSIFKTPNSERKWAIHMNEANLDWTTIYRLSFKATLSTKLRYFQFQFLHRYLPLNKLLFDIKFIDSKLCSLCKIDDETLQHFLGDCRIAHSFWLEVQEILHKELHNSFIITNRDVFFCITDLSF